MILGVGIDMIEVDRIRRLLTKDQGFKERIFTPKEQAYCETKKYKAQNYAARFAAKEAFFKALGTGWRGGMAFHEIEVLNDDLGKPEIILHGKAKQLAEEKGVKRVHVSLSHLRDVACSMVTIEK